MSRDSGRHPGIRAEIPGFRGDISRFWPRQRDSGRNLWIPAEISGLWPKSLDSSRNPGTLVEISGFQAKSLDVAATSPDSGRHRLILADFPGSCSDFSGFWPWSRDSNRCPGMHGGFLWIRVEAGSLGWVFRDCQALQASAAPEQPPHIHGDKTALGSPAGHRDHLAVDVLAPRLSLPLQDEVLLGGQLLDRRHSIPPGTKHSHLSPLAQIVT
jgi:hypothetical protein